VRVAPLADLLRKMDGKIAPVRAASAKAHIIRA
jgi:hypothetical protein